MADKMFQVVDAVGSVYLSTRADESYEVQFRKHVSWWRGYVQTKEYRDKVDPYRWPCAPLRIEILECG